MIKQIDKSEFLSLELLWLKYHSIVSPQSSAYDTIAYLYSSLKNIDSVAIGAYTDSKLVGFTLGYKITDEVYFWEAIYCRHMKLLPELIRVSEEYIKLNGYTKWLSEANTIHGYKLLNKIALPITNKTFIKDIKWVE